MGSSSTTESAISWESSELLLPRTRSGRRGDRVPNKLWCHLYLDENMLRPGFNLNKKIIGHGGNCTKSIYDATGAKIRLRGIGSKHLEGGREAPVHLMLAVTTELSEQDNFIKAVEKSIGLLRDVETRFNTFCKQKKQPTPTGPCFWVGELSLEARAYLNPILGILIHQVAHH